MLRIALLAALASTAAATPTQAPSADGLHPVPSPTRSFSPTVHPSAKPTGPTFGPTSSPTYGPTNPYEDDEETVNSMAVISKILYVPYALGMMVLGVYTSCLTQKDPFTPLQRSESRMIVGFWLIISALLTMPAFTNSDESAGSYQFFSVLCLVGLLNITFYFCMAALMNYKEEQWQAKYDGGKKGRNSIICFGFFVYGLICVLARAVAVNYWSGNELICIGWFVFIAILGYCFIEKYFEWLERRHMPTDGVEYTDKPLSQPITLGHKSSGGDFTNQNTPMSDVDVMHVMHREAEMQPRQLI